MKIAIATPPLGPPTWHYLRSLVEFQTYHYDRHPDVPIVLLNPPRQLAIGPARSLMAHIFLQTDCDWLWWLDQDCLFLPQTLDRLLSWDEAIVGALCMMRNNAECMPMALRGKGQRDDLWKVLAQEVYEFVARTDYDYETNAPQILDPAPDDSLMVVDFTGCHCLLTHRYVFEAFPEPHFNDTFQKEDMYFCLEAAKAGFPTYIDRSVLVGHSAVERSIGLFDFYSHFRFKAELANAKD